MRHYVMQRIRISTRYVHRPIITLIFFIFHIFYLFIFLSLRILIILLRFETAQS